MQINNDRFSWNLVNDINSNNNIFTEKSIDCDIDNYVKLIGQKEYVRILEINKDIIESNINFIYLGEVQNENLDKIYFNKVHIIENISKKSN